MYLKRMAIGLAATLAAATAHAQIGAAVTADLGTTGAGVHLVVPMESNLNGRFGINYYKHDLDTRSGDIDYKGDAKLQTFDVLFDWYIVPNSNFRLTGGVIYNGNKVEAQGYANSQGNYIINKVSYTAADVGTLSADVDFQRAAPYFGVGWGNALTQSKRWNFAADIGAFYQGKAHVNLVSRGCTTSTGVCRLLVRDLGLEEQRLSDELAKHKFFPVLRASVSYNF